MPQLKISPKDAFQPEPITIRSYGFGPGERVLLESHLVDELGVEWKAWGQFVADVSGVVDIADAPSEGGSYTGLDAAGLFWSMQPSSGVDRSFQTQATDMRHMGGVPALDPVMPYTVEITARGASGVAHSQVRIHRLRGDIEVLDVKDGRVRGKAFRWRDRSRKRGAIMTMTGSDGGRELGYSPLLASLGYDVLGIAYFAYDDLPANLESIPLEYFEEAFERMRREFQCEKIAVQGGSRGGELTLILASYLPNYVNGCIAVVPMFATVSGWNHSTNAMGPSWTFRGKDIPYTPWEVEPMSKEGIKRRAEAEPLGLELAPLFRAALDTPEARATSSIPVERADGPILCISGVEDAIWPCAWASDIVMNRLRAHGYKHHFQHLALRETGHATPTPNKVTTFTQAAHHNLAHVFLARGGNPQGAARASWLMWDTIRQHYQRVFGH